MMFAPKSGEETRALLREKAQGGIDEVVAQGKKVARKAQAAADNAKEFVGEAVDALKKAKADFEALADRVRSIEQGIVAKVETTTGTIKKAL